MPYEPEPGEEEAFKRSVAETASLTPAERLARVTEEKPEPALTVPRVMARLSEAGVLGVHLGSTAAAIHGVSTHRWR